MAKDLLAVDVTATPEVLRLAEEVRRSGTPRLLRRDGEDLAVLSPVGGRTRRRSGRAISAEDRTAFLASAGGWRGNVEVDRFLEESYASRDRSSRAPVDL